MFTNAQTDHITYDEFRTAIDSAVHQRNSAYSNAYALSIRWEDDDTRAHEDTAHFQCILKMLGLPKADELVLQPTDRTPGWTVQSSMVEMLEAARISQGKAIILCHYAGRAYHDKGAFMATAQADERPMNLGVFCLDLALDRSYYLADIDHVDVVFFLDCYYGFEASRAPPNSGDRIVEILAATGKTPRSALGLPPARNTVTGILAVEMMRRQREGHRSVEFADLVQALRGRDTVVVTPVHGLTMGASSAIRDSRLDRNSIPLELEFPLRRMPTVSSHRL
ncbi:hypothetical protein P168DRAFT_325150 [Aspergillus campestris IBT 28561]|uniref:Uncharacterized protein n=1 Tax=Aspergillus campestris (strain IBT 28561) TaxID=1392248 RepID=A0A2I1D8Q5_ASPC2|nr:uncharacterized protein P168DRAFT_325150 [Aspergillus campestris IBT 28561]PKY06263.1 hypothetical protein P168DRAFT_325150 [Aspergillus campestris IBT 28561]